MSNSFPAKFVTEWPYHTDYGYDEESYPNLYTIAMEHMQSSTVYFFEISSWQNDLSMLINAIYWLHQNRCRQIGFNNVGYDYPVLHFIFMNAPYWGGLTGEQIAQEIYKFSSSIFKQQHETEDQYFKRKWRVVVKDNETIIPQIDLYKIYHFDNKNKATSLKVLEINMRSDTVKELPIKPGTWLTYEQRCQIIPYNIKDVKETVKFAKFSLPEIQLRERLSEKFNVNMMNFSEGKIGETIIKNQLIKAGISVNKKTPRPVIRVRDIIFPYIRFNRPEFIELLQFLNNQVITKTNDDDEKEKKYPCAMVNGFPWQFGKGGMHGSVESTIVRSDSDREIWDVDVTGFYPETGIVNGKYPEHLGPQFCVEYRGVANLRAEYPKGTMENMAFKYAQNVPYGKSNEQHSFLYDPQYTMTITINGQLLLCMLGEWLLTVPGLSMIQANTDGITFIAPRIYHDHIKAICKQWEQFTCLSLEYAYYQAMYIRDVNNYIAHYVPDEKNPQGKLKSKGAYVHKEIPWNKDHSMVIVARAVEEFFINGKDVVQTIMSCRDPFDFMIKGKVPKNCQLWLTYDNMHTVQLQNTTRYYVAINGGKLTKIMPYTESMLEHWKTGTHYIRARDGDYKVVKPGGKRPAKTYDEIPAHLVAPEPEDRTERIQSGWLVADCADAADFNWNNVNYGYYIKEAMKLIDPLLKQ